MSHEYHTWSWHSCTGDLGFLLEGFVNCFFPPITNEWYGASRYISSIGGFIFLSSESFGLPPSTVIEKIKLKTDVWCLLSSVLDLEGHQIYLKGFFVEGC